MGLHRSSMTRLVCTFLGEPRHRARHQAPAFLALTQYDGFESPASETSQVKGSLRELPIVTLTHDLTPRAAKLSDPCF